MQGLEGSMQTNETDIFLLRFILQNNIQSIINQLENSSRYKCADFILETALQSATQQYTI